MFSTHPTDDQPLDLSVHSLVSTGAADASGGPRRRSGRWKMALVFLVCVAPVVASYFTYYVIRPEGRRNFGELVQPQRALPDVVGTALDGSSVSLPSLKGQWLLVSVSSGACDETCARHLYLQRQLRESLGKEKDRLDWVWLVSDSAPVPQEMLAGLQSATVIRVARGSLEQWLQPQAGHSLAEHLYLVDPLGNWMMRFPPGLDPQGATHVKRDLDRLLRASSSWDQPGR